MLIIWKSGTRSLKIGTTIQLNMVIGHHMSLIKKLNKLHIKTIVFLRHFINKYVCIYLRQIIKVRLWIRIYAYQLLENND